MNNDNLPKEKTNPSQNTPSSFNVHKAAAIGVSALAGMTAFPFVSEAVYAEEAAQKPEENELVNEITNESAQTVEGTEEAVETAEVSEERDVLSEEEQEEELLIREQLIYELQRVLTEDMLEQVNLEELAAEDLEDLLVKAIESGLVDSDFLENLEMDVEVPEEETEVVEVQAEAVDTQETDAEEADQQPEEPAAVSDAEAIVDPVFGKTPVAEEDIQESEETVEEAPEIEEVEVEVETEEAVVEPKIFVAPKAAEEVTPVEESAPETTSPEEKAETKESVKAEKTTTSSVKKTEEKAEEKKEDETILYTVKSGDTLNNIAAKYGTTADRLAELNKLSNKNVIKVGQILSINKPVSQTPAANPNDINDKELNKKQTPAEFIETITPFASKVAEEYRLYASVMIAQASLESGYGKSSLSSPPNHNMFGIKGRYNGESVTMYTNEYSTSTGWIRLPQAFKKYPSYAESFEDNAKLLRNGLSWSRTYYAGTWLENTTSYRDATAWLEGRYATDPTYAAKLNGIIEAYNLTRFDIVDTSDNVSKPAQPKPEQPIETDKPTENVVHIVKSGDTLSGLAVRYGTTVAQIKSA
ncbi:glucosaminidase domain-containing protein, partial [Atopococcus tabaci]|uniref:glucosaminidase domain-containing protein n=1 Tax=Atopococcus tabaci TaxID=269774 RepID=UPI00146FB32A